MKVEGIAVVLAYGAARADDLDDEARRLHDDINVNQAEIEALSDRLEPLAGTTGTHLDAASSQFRGSHRTASEGRPPAWAELVALAQENLRERGIDAQQIDLDALLDPDEVRRLDQRHQGGFTIQADLDPYDILIAVAAGLTAAIVDALVVRTPSGSPPTRALQRLAIDCDNPLGDWAKVPYDRIADLFVLDPQGNHIPMSVKGLYPKGHRVQAPGHDPLLGLVMGTWNIMKGQMTAIETDGVVKFIDSPVDPVPNIFRAFAKELLHLFSDAPTKCALPPPGWAALANVGVGQFGPDAKTVGDVARDMYLKGYNSWHLLTMMSSAASLEIVLRGYWGLRSSLDAEWRASVELEARVASSTSTSDHPRYAAMALAANGVAAAGNLGKVAMVGGNPLALNYAQWAAFLRAFYKWANSRMASPGAVVDARVRANAMAIAAGWDALDFTDPAFPSPTLA